MSYIPPKIQYGIPQGSVMGPLLFNIFINDIVHTTSQFDLVMYADDTTLISTLENFGSITDPQSIQNSINEELKKIFNWLRNNELLLNVEKSKLMYFFKHPKIIPDLAIKINNCTIERINSFNFLGITLDENITWKAHTDKIALKLARVTGLLRKLQHIFPPYILITIHNALVLSHLNYGLLLWGYENERIFLAQKKVMRVIGFRPYIAHTTPIFKNLKMLKLEDMFTNQLRKLYYKFNSDILPQYFQQFKPMYNDDVQNTHNLRSINLRLPIVTREYFARSARYQFLKCIQAMTPMDLNTGEWNTIFQYSTHYKYSMLEKYDPICRRVDCYTCLHT